MNARLQPVWTMEGFIAWENEQPERHEFYRGEIFAMSGGRRSHGCVVGNLMRHFGNQLAGTACRAFTENMKVQMADEAITYPDLFVTCDRADLRTDQIFRSPTLIVEVLSPSTQAYDRSLKFAMHRGLASLQEYILVDPDSKRIEAFRRGADGLWDLHDQSDTGRLEAASVGVRMSHAEVFDGVDPPGNLWNRAPMTRRVLDWLVAAPALVVALPLCALIALAVKLDSPGPALFRQQRVGRGGAPFEILKFRTMQHRPAEPAAPITVGDDHRITRAGRWLRRSRLDELPQLLNVLRGEMALVGPRPELPRYVALYPEPLKARVLAVRPGLTDPSSLAYLDEAAELAQAQDPETHYVEVILPRKLRMAAAYAEQATVWSDLSVLVHTLRRLVRRSGRSGGGAAAAPNR